MWTTTIIPYLSNLTLATARTSLEMTTSSTVSDLCPSMQKFGRAYKGIHGYTSLTVCIFGAIANILNLIVLTRKEMITPTNHILTALAFADLLNMVEYVPFTIYMKFLPASQKEGLRKTYPWAVFVLFHSNFSQVCHTISIWLTLTLAIWRYIMVTRPVKCKSLCSMRRANMAIALAYIVPPLLCIPIYCSFSITAISPSTKPENITFPNFGEEDYLNISSFLLTTELPWNVTTGQNGSPVKYVVNLSNLAKSTPLLKQFNFWFFSIVIKLIPCAILTVVSFRLINSLLEAKKRKELLFGEKHHPRVFHPQPTPPPPPPPPAAIVTTAQSGGNNSSTENEEPVSRSSSFTRSTGEMCATTRTTRMLVAILLLFLLTEFPQGILALMSDLRGEEFFTFCYTSLSEMMDILALLNSGINFILYCTMSRNFRVAFNRIFRLDRLSLRRNQLQR